MEIEGVNSSEEQGLKAKIHEPKGLVFLFGKITSCPVFAPHNYKKTNIFKIYHLYGLVFTVLPLGFKIFQKSRMPDVS